VSSDSEHPPGALPVAPAVRLGPVELARRSARWDAARVDLVLVAALTLLALGLRLAVVGQSLFGDELFLYSDVHGHSLHEVYVAVRETEKTPPLGFVLGWIFARGGHAETLVRVPSLIAGVALVPLVWALGRRTVGRVPALVSAAWIALSPFQIFYATETRAYAQVTAWVVLSTLALLVALEDGRRRWWALYAVAAAGAVYSHYIAFMIVLPQAAWALWTRRDRIREQLLAGGLVVLVFLPWVPAFTEQVRNSSDEARRLDLVAPLTASRLGETWAKTFVGHPYVSLRHQPGLVALIVLAVVVVGVLVALAAGGGRVRGRDVRPRHGVLLLALALAAPVIIVLYGLRPHASFLLPRNLSVSLPYAVLLLAWALTAVRVRIAAVAVAVALGALAVGSVQAVEPVHQRTDSRGAAQWIDAHGPAGAPLIDIPGPHAVRIYLRRPRPVWTIAQFPPARWAAAARAGTPVLISYPDVPGARAYIVPPRGAGSGYRLVAQRIFPGIPYRMGVREFARR
jgi:hypothetical protein